MSKGDGRNPKFRVLCKKCNSYQHTNVAVVASVGDHASMGDLRLRITCTKCRNAADSFEEE